MDTLTDGTTRTSRTLEIINKMPQVVIDQLMAVADRWRSDYWFIGELTNVMLAWARDNGYQDSELYAAISTLLNQECSPRTVRYYAETVDFYKKIESDTFEIDRYSDLPFSHFAFAKQYGAELAIEILKRSDARAVELGRPPSVAWLELNSVNLIIQDSLPVEDEQEPGQVESSLSSYDENQGESEPVQSNYKLLVFSESLKQARNYLERLASTTALPQRLRTTVAEVINSLQGLLDDLQSYIDT